MTSTCGCCSAPAAATPLLVYNRPSLSAIQYRIGTYSSFRQAMIEGIADVTFDIAGGKLRPLLNWTSRDSSDLGIAVIEMWAYLCDILTFYQECTANEAYLRTARLRESVLRLAALLGYEPAPGLAAMALLAFTLEKGKQLQIPVGLRVQSVPGQNEKPQKFETIESVAVDALWNSVRIHPQPKAFVPFQAGQDSGPLAASLAMTPPLAPRNNLVVFKGGGVAEDKIVENLLTADGRTTLTWSPMMIKDLGGGHMYRWVRKMRLFGANAPATYLVAKPGASSFELQWSTATTVFILPSTTALALDASYADLKSGQVLLVQTGNASTIATIQSVSQITAAVGDPGASVPALTGSVTQVTLDANPATGSDLRNVVVYLLDTPEITFQSNTYDPTITTSTATIYLEDGASFANSGQLAPGRSIIIDDVAAIPQVVTVTAAGSLAPFSPGDPTQWLAVSINPPLARDLDGATAFLYGNVANSSHGETVAAEVLGNGDASATFQAFTLAKSPVTYLPKAGAPHGAGSTLEIRVDPQASTGNQGILRNEVPSFFGHGPKERIYVTSRDNQEVTTVEAGDGNTGAPFTTGRGNVVAHYRVGLGTAGNLKAGVLKNLLDRPVGLKAVVNPLPSAGGADPELLEQARSNAPTTVRTFGRIVSLLDFENVALDYPGIAKARAIFTWVGEDQAVLLTVAGAGNTIVQGQTMDNLVKDLDSRRDPNRMLIVRPHTRIPIQVSAAVQPDTPTFVAGDVQSAVAQVLLDRFAFDNVDLGQSVHLSDIYAVIQSVAGVIGADVDVLRFKMTADRLSHADSDARQNALLIFPSEIPYIDDTVNDITVTLGLE